MKKFKIEYLLYIFIIITPFLDVFACLFREIFPNAVISPSTVIRPIIPFVLTLYILKDVDARKYIIIGGLLFIIYGSTHLLIYNKLLTGIACGNVFSEAQYILNYTYMIYVLFIFLYFIKRSGLPYLKQSLLLMLCEYLLLIYVSIITGTSYSTYVEGIGFRGWFISGNSLGAILILLMSILISDLLNNKKIYNYVILLLLGIYLMFLIGTRVGLFGFLLVLGVFILSFFGMKFIKDKKISISKIFIVCGVFIVLGSLVLLFGSSTLDRRKHLKNEDSGIIDVNTGKVGHTTFDTSVFVKQINNDELSDNDLSKSQKKAYLDLYKKANEKEIGATDRRKQQFIYHVSLIKNQKNILYILFGNGYLANYTEMTLEIELFAILFNFGLIGFIFYLLPFILVAIYSIKKIIKKKKISLEIIMYSFGFLLAMCLSCFTGAVFFSVSCVLVIVCMLSLLYKEGEKL